VCDEFTVDCPNCGSCLEIQLTPVGEVEAWECPDCEITHETPGWKDKLIIENKDTGEHYHVTTNR
jgi:Zn-finger nucleic acid-binding protein